MLLIKVIFSIIVYIKFCDCANILAIFPAPSISHQVVFRALTNDLIKRGHSLTILTPNPINSGNPNVTEIDLGHSTEIFKKQFSYAHLKDTLNDIIGFMRKATVTMEDLMNDQLSNPEVKKLINGKGKHKFDLMIMEHTGFLPYLAFAEIYECPVVGIISFEPANMMYQQFGNGANIMIHPEQFFTYSLGQMNFLERANTLRATFHFLIFLLTPPFPLQKLNNVLSNHFPDVSSGPFELLDKVELFLVNTNPALGFVRPLVPNTIQLGFMHIEPPQPLKEGALKKFLDNSENGVIYLSFGSNFLSKDLGIDTVNMFLNVFRNSKFDVVWKFEGDEIPNKPKNVYIEKWLPQADLLAHPKIRLFITQAGYQSIEEAIDRTVPMIAIPILADQKGTARKLHDKGVALLLDFDTLTEDGLSSAINEMTKPIYKENIKLLRVLAHDQPMTSRDKAVWWVEYVLRHKGSKHLAYPGRLVPFYQKYCLDFIAIAILLFYFIRKVMKFIFKFFSQRKLKHE